MYHVLQVPFIKQHVLGLHVGPVSVDQYHSSRAEAGAHAMVMAKVCGKPAAYSSS
jgi:hypothetical protein